ncbi:DUF6059 family protein [Streptomyces sp. NPDC006289]|uniref:DUF6059 family protein n=1 Tax=Streptomyces sp. NPDC006289 TaxID=3156744 RepID=UPI0033A38A76
MRYVSRALHEIRTSLTAAGWMWLGLPLGGPLLPTATRASAPPSPSGPPEGHPERLRPDLPLTPTERVLREQLMAPTGERD